MGGVNVTESNGNLSGAITIADGVVGLALTGVTEGGGYTMGTPILVTSMVDVATAGITNANNPFAIKHLTEFYNEAPIGSKLYLMLVANTLTIANIWDNTNANGMKKLLQFAAGAIKVAGATTDDKAVHTAGGTITVTNGMNADVYTAATNAKTMEASFRSAQQPFRAIIGASSYNGTASALSDESTGTSNNKAAIVVGDTVVWDATYTSSCIGLVMGRIAQVPVQAKISKVKDENGSQNPLSNTTAYLGATALASTGGDAVTIAGKNYITWRIFPQTSGFFFSGDPMLTVSTDDYAFLARCRVIDKAHVIAYTVFVNEVDDDIPTIAGGFPDPGYCVWLQQQIINQLNNTMGAAGNISGEPECFIDPTQNVVSTSTLNVVLEIQPKGYLSTINISLGFAL